MSEWIEYLIHLFQYQSLSIASIDNVNSRNTGNYWLKKVFSVLSRYQDGIRFSGTVWVDETYLQEPPRATVLKDGKRMAGLSRNQNCVVTMAQEGHKGLVQPLCVHLQPPWKLPKMIHDFFDMALKVRKTIRYRDKR